MQGDSGMIEVELKFELSPGSWTQLQTQLGAIPLVCLVGRVDDVDIYYDTASFDCFRQAVFLRMRNHARLEIKFHEDDDPDHIRSTERVFPLESGPQLVKEMNALCARFIPNWCEVNTVEDAIHANGLVELARIRKQRTQYTCKDLILCIDHVEGLGDFFEMEAHAQEGTETDQAVAMLQSFVHKLALPGLQPVRIGYVEMWLRQHFPQLYHQGKYRVENYAD
jgi:adenylate cyclase, class 2